MLVDSASLLSALKNPAKVTYSNKVRDLTSSLLGTALGSSPTKSTTVTSFAAYGSNLTKAQKSSLNSLQSYINDFVKGDDAKKMRSEIASLQMVMEMTNSLSPKKTSAYDMTTDMFGGNGSTSLVPGLFYNKLF